MTAPSLSVVMPYYKNERTLVRSITSLCAQGCPQLREIIVVDDGGDVRAEALVAKRHFDVPVIVERMANSGQSAATNCGIMRATGEVIVLTCADIIAAPKFLEAHLDAHVQFAESIAVCGNIRYAPWLRMSPFMRYLEQPNVQFNFEDIPHPDSVSAGSFYAPNVSARRSDLVQAGLFDEKLVYGFQDVDLGLKMAAQGVRLVYRKNSIALHDHPNSPAQFFDRQVRVGRMLPRFLHNHPSNSMAWRFVQTIDKTLVVLPQAERLLAQMRDIEARISARPAAFAQLRQPLFDFYNLVMTLGAIKGALQTGDLLREALHIPAAKWRNYCAQMRDFSLTETAIEHKTQNGKTVVNNKTSAL